MTKRTTSNTNTGSEPKENKNTASEETCLWTYRHRDRTNFTECGARFTLHGGRVEPGRFKNCPYCGKKVIIGQ